MKLLSYIFVSILFLSGLCFTSDAFPSQINKSVWTLLHQDNTVCCKHKAEKSPMPEKEAPCEEECYCYCCIVIIATSSITTASLAFRNIEEGNSWYTDIYSQEFTHHIWRPPLAV